MREPVQDTPISPSTEDLRTLLKLAEAGVYLTIAVSQEEPPMINWPKEWDNFRLGVLQFCSQYRQSPARYIRRYRTIYPPGMGMSSLTALVEKGLRLLELAVWELGKEDGGAGLTPEEEELWELAVEAVWEMSTADTEEGVKMANEKEVG